MLTDQKKYEEAEPIYPLVLKGFERVFGQGHRNMQSTRYHLAKLLNLQERYEEAEAIFSTEECLRFRDDESEDDEFEDDAFEDDEFEDNESEDADFGDDERR